MTLEQLLEKMYAELIPTFLKNVPDDRKDEFKVLYEHRLLDNYSQMLNELTTAPVDEQENTVRMIVNKEKMRWVNATFENKQQYFYVDEAYVKLCDLSNEVFEKLIEQYHDETADLIGMNYDEVMRKANEYLEGCDEYNREFARKTYAYLTIDLNYLHRKSDTLSLRFQDYIESNPTGTSSIGINADKVKNTEELVKTFESNPNELVRKAELALAEENYEETNELLDAFLRIAEFQYKDTATDKYFCFNNSLEHLLYIQRYSPEAYIHNINLDTNKAYLLKSYVLSDQKRYREALSYLDSAYAWNPIYVNAFLKQAKIYRELGEYDNWRDTLHKAHDFIYDAYSLQRYYRYLGYYYRTMGDLETAKALHTLSYIYYPEEKNILAIEQMAEEQGVSVTGMEFEEIQRLLTEKNIPISANPINVTILEIIYENSKDNKEINDYAKSLLFGLTKSDKYAE